MFHTDPGPIKAIHSKGLDTDSTESRDTQSKDDDISNSDISSNTNITVKECGYFDDIQIKDKGAKRNVHVQNVNPQENLDVTALGCAFVSSYL